MIARSANFFSTHFVKELVWLNHIISLPHHISNWCGSRHTSHTTSGAPAIAALALTLAALTLTLPPPPYKKTHRIYTIWKSDPKRLRGGPDPRTPPASYGPGQ